MYKLLGLLTGKIKRVTIQDMRNKCIDATIENMNKGYITGFNSEQQVKNCYYTVGNKILKKAYNNIVTYEEKKFLFD